MVRAAHGSSRPPGRRAERALASLLAALLTLACRPTAPPVPAIALGELGEHLYVAAADELRVFAVTARRGPARPRPLAAPCAPLLDLDLYGPFLHVLCGDGRIFARHASDLGDPSDETTWRAVAPRPAPTGAGAPLIAFQHSDNALLGVHADGTFSVVAPPDRAPPEHPLDRFRGPDRGGPGELPVAAFAVHAPHFAHGFARRRAAELTAVIEGRGFTCRIPGRGGRIRDLALGRASIAAVHLDRRGRARVVVVHPRAPWRSPFAGAHDPLSGRRLAPWIRCSPP